MSKLKSTIALVLITILILGVCFMSTVSFSYGYDQMYTFNSIISALQKDSNLGGTLFDGENYVGGGYSSVYYPEGVISVQEYTDNLAQLNELLAMTDQNDPDYKERKDAVEDYVARYDQQGSVYLEKSIVYGDKDGTEVSDDFIEDFENAEAILRNRLERLHMEGVRLDVRDDFTFRVTMPTYSGAQAVMLNYFSYMGEVDMGSGSDAGSATRLLLGDGETIRDYIKSADSFTVNGTAYVQLDFTSKGAEKLAEWTTAALDDAPVTLFFYIGEEAIVSLTVTEPVKTSTLFISGGYTAETARAVALTIESSLKCEPSELVLSVGETVRLEAAFGNLALVLLYVGFGVLFVGMMVFFIMRYRALAVAHLYTFLVWILAMILLLWASYAVMGLSGMHIGIETFAAIVIAGTLLCVSNIVTFENVRKEYALGKTMSSAVKAGYKRCIWQLFDLHIALALLSAIMFAISLTELSVFAFTLLIGVLLSGLCTLAVNRFHWAAFMVFAKDEGKFCNFKREAQVDE